MKCKAHPEAAPFIERGNYRGKPIIGADHATDEGGDPVTILRIRTGNSTGTVMFDSFGDEDDGLDHDEDGLS